MILRHATLRRHLAPILRHGIDPACALSRFKASWLHAPGKSPWALCHVVARHRSRCEQVVVVEVDVPRSALRRWGRGLWYTLSVIRPGRFTRVIEFGEVASSPVMEVG